MAIFITTAASEFFYMKLAIVAPDAKAAEQTARAFVSPQGHTDMMACARDGETDDDASAYEYEVGEVSRADDDDAEKLTVRGGWQGLVLMLDSGANG